MFRPFQRSFSVTVLKQIKRNHLPPRPKFTTQMESDCTESFIHGGSGAGGQKINKTSSKVQLKHVPTGIVITSQATRSRDQNRKIAREKMAYELSKFNSSDSSGETERDTALRQLKQQNKKAKLKKSSKKHLMHKEMNEKIESEQKKADDELIRKMLLGD